MCHIQKNTAKKLNLNEWMILSNLLFVNPVWYLNSYVSVKLWYYNYQVLEPLHSHLYYEQESPPAWTQEAYRLQQFKYSICCPIREGVPTLAGGRYLGVTPPSCPDMAKGGSRYLGRGWGRYLGVPLSPSLWPCWGTPPSPVWTDWKHYLPPSFGCGR